MLDRPSFPLTKLMISIGTNSGSNIHFKTIYIELRKIVRNDNTLHNVIVRILNANKNAIKYIDICITQK